MAKWGRVTAALTLVAVGVMLILDVAGIGDSWTWMRLGWPLVLIALGVELIVLQLVAQSRNLRIRVYWGGMLGTAFLVGLAVLFLHGDRVATNVANLSRIGSWAVPDIAGERFDLKEIRAELAPDVSSVIIRHQTGRVEIRQDDAVKEMVVHASVHVNAEREKAEEIAGRIRLDIRRTGNRLELVSEVPSYGPWWQWWRKPRVDLAVTLPGGVLPAVAVELTSGSVEAAGLDAELRIAMKNGDIRVANIGGNVEAKTINGNIRATDVEAGAVLASTNGNVTGSRIGGTVRATTVNGNVSLAEVRADVRARTVNGNVAIRSLTVAGDWSVGTTRGSVRLEIPDTADMTVQAESRFGRISTDLPLAVEGKTATGRLGAGTHRMTVDTNGNITLVRHRP